MPIKNKLLMTDNFTLEQNGNEYIFWGKVGEPIPEKEMKEIYFELGRLLYPKKEESYPVKEMIGYAS